MKLAQQDMDTATKALKEIEQKVGGDLVELRILSDSPSGDSNLRRNLVELEKELRGYRATQVENEETLALLKAAQTDPEKLLASPDVLMRSQPGLKRLKEGLVNAQLRSGQALGTMSEEHPLVKGAVEAERVIRDQLHDEIGSAIKGAEAELHIGADRIQAVQKEIASSRERLTRLVGLRAEYANTSATVRNRAELLKNVERELAEARASLVAARAASRISPIGAPDAGTRPVGPGRSTIAAAGFGGGLLIAAAVLFLLTTPRSVHDGAVAQQPPVAAQIPAADQPPATPRQVARETESPPTISLLTPHDGGETGPLTLSKALQRVAS